MHRHLAVIEGNRFRGHQAHGTRCSGACLHYAKGSSHERARHQRIAVARYSIGLRLSRAYQARMKRVGGQAFRITAHDSPQYMSIAENLERVRERIARAAESSGRSASEITLVGVTKYVGPREATALVEAGCQDLGESRPQELWSKADKLGVLAAEGLPIHWHLIGHLQRNKIRRTLPLVSLIHSIDSERLLDALNREISQYPEAAQLGSRAPLRVLLEVNTSGEAAKHGLEPEEVEPVLGTATRFPHVRICGLMTMAAHEGGAVVAARNFASLRELRNRLQPNAPDCVSLDALSMGMSGDFEIAICEGATIVRIGSLLWEQA